LNKPKTINVLDLLKQLLDRHPTSYGASGIQVIPALFDGTLNVRRVIEATIACADGQFIDAHAPKYALGTAGEVESGLRDLVKSKLAIDRDTGRGKYRIGISQKRGQVRVTLDGRDASVAPNLSLQDLLGIVTALFDTRLRETELAVISYRDVNLDGPWADAVWNLFTQHVHGQTVASLKTLVVLVQSKNAFVPRHFLPGTTGISLAYWLKPGGLDVRQEWATTRSSILRLKPKSPQVLVLFLGAGFSLTSGLELGDTYRNRALFNILQQNVPPPELCRLFYNWLRDQRRLLRSEEHLSSAEIEQFAASLTLERVLREEYDLCNGPAASPTLADIRAANDRAILAPGLAPQALRRIIDRKDQTLVLVTVNYDMLVETGGGVKVFASDDQFETFGQYIVSGHTKVATGGHRAPAR
jgi:hypothetical protein